MSFYLLPEAEVDVECIWLYVAEESASAETAVRLIRTITECFSAIGQNPRMGRRRDHDLRAGLRSFPSGEYVIIYRVQGEDVYILHVIHGSRDIQGLLKN